MILWDKIWTTCWHTRRRCMVGARCRSNFSPLTLRRPAAISRTSQLRTKLLLTTLWAVYRSQNLVTLGIVQKETPYGEKTSFSPSASGRMKRSISAFRRRSLSATRSSHTRRSISPLPQIRLYKGLRGESKRAWKCVSGDIRGDCERTSSFRSVML